MLGSRMRFNNPAVLNHGSRCGGLRPPQTRHIVDSRRTTSAQILPLIAFCHHDDGGLKLLGGRLGTAILPRSLRPFLILAENVIVQEKREGWVGLVPCGQAPAGSRDIPGSRDFFKIPIPGFSKI